jgi:hypothetical protein
MGRDLRRCGDIAAGKLSALGACKLLGITLDGSTAGAPHLTPMAEMVAASERNRQKNTQAPWAPPCWHRDAEGKLVSREAVASAATFANGP